MPTAALGRGWSDDELAALARDRGRPVRAARRHRRRPSPRCSPTTASSPGSRAAASTGRARWATARCSPTRGDAENLERLNDVKGREQFRPVAPMVLAERAPEIFDAARSRARTCCSCTTCAGVARTASRRSCTSTAPPGSRPSTATTSRWWRGCSSAFEARTGLPVVVNTASTPPAGRWSTTRATRWSASAPRRSTCWRSGRSSSAAPARRRAARVERRRAAIEPARRRRPDRAAGPPRRAARRAAPPGAGRRVDRGRRPAGGARCRCRTPSACARRSAAPARGPGRGAQRRLARRRARRGSPSSTTTCVPDAGLARRAARRPARPRGRRRRRRRAGCACRCPPTGGRPTGSATSPASQTRALDHRRHGLPPGRAGARRRLRRALPARVPRGRRPRPAASSPAGWRLVRGERVVVHPVRPARPLGQRAPAGRQRRRRADARAARPRLARARRRARAAAAPRHAASPRGRAAPPALAAARGAPPAPGRAARGRAAWAGRHRRVRRGAGSRPARATAARGRDDARDERRDPARAPPALVAAPAHATVRRRPAAPRGRAAARAVRPRRHAGRRRALQRRPGAGRAGARRARALDRLRAPGCDWAWSPTSRASRAGCSTGEQVERGQRAGRGAARPVRPWQVCPHGPGRRLRVPQARARAGPAAAARAGRRPGRVRGGRRHRRRRRGRARRRRARRCSCPTAAHPARGGRRRPPEVAPRPRATRSTRLLGAPA